MFEFLGYTLVGPTDGMIILSKSYLPHIEKAHKLARCLTLDEIDEVLAGKKHLHKNRGRKDQRNHLPPEMIPIPGGPNPATSGVDE